MLYCYDMKTAVAESNPDVEILTYKKNFFFCFSPVALGFSLLLFSSETPWNKSGSGRKQKWIMKSVMTVSLISDWGITKHNIKFGRGSGVAVVYIMWCQEEIWDTDRVPDEASLLFTLLHKICNSSSPNQQSREWKKTKSDRLSRFWNMLRCSEVLLDK